MRKQKEAPGMERSWLVQRLKKPYAGGIFGGKDNPFSFGGGLRNGGLSDEAMDLLRGIFSFDYMGAAEFEFGAVPKALQAIAKDIKKYKAFSFTFPRKDVVKGWRDKSTTDPEGDVTIYVICHKDHVDGVTVRITDWACEPKAPSLKESTMLSQTLRPDSDWNPGIAGWLELNNGFFFFIDEEMWKKTTDLFGLEA